MISNDLVKALTTDCDEIQTRCIDNLARDFAEALDIEGCFDKVEILYEKQIASMSDEDAWVALMASSRINLVITEALKRATHLLRNKNVTIGGAD